jgi:hypothetical protein
LGLKFQHKQEKLFLECLILDQLLSVGVHSTFKNSVQQYSTATLCLDEKSVSVLMGPNNWMHTTLKSPMFKDLPQNHDLEMHAFWFYF